MSFPTRLPAPAEVDAEVRLLAPALADLHQPRRRRYWTDFLLSALFGWALLVLGSLSSVPLLTALALLLATGALYRAVQFIHELEHLRPGTVPGLATAWFIVVGLPFLLPRFLHGCHHAHHDGRTYGTLRDPEYSPTLGASRLGQLAFVSVAALAPLLLGLRALVLAPISFLVPPLRRWLLRRASTLGMNLAYERTDLISNRGPRGWRREEAWVTSSAGAWLTLLLTGVLDVRTLLLGGVVMSGVALLDQLKTLAVHRFVGKTQRLSHGQQALDAIDIAGGLLSEVWAPLNGRLHALHHLLPALPYHALPEARRRLEGVLPRDAWLRRASEPSLGHALAWLRGPGVDVPSAASPSLPRYRSPGHMGQVLGCVPELTRDFRATLVRAASEHGPLSELSVPGRRIFALHDPAAAQIMLSTERAAFSKETPGFHAMRAVLGRGLITADGDEWLANRKRAQGMFKPDRLARLGSQIESLVRERVEGWGQAGTFDLAAACSELTLDITAKTLFDIDLAQQRALHHDLRIITSQSERRLLTTAGAWLPTRHNRAWKSALRRLDLFLFDLIANRHVRRRTHDSTASDADQGDLLDGLLRAHPESPGQVRDEAVTFLLAGHETTAMSALWTFVLLNRFPNADTSSVRRTVLESLRLMPPVWLLGRRAERALDISGQHVPAGAFVLVSPWILHRRADLYPEPERFDPTRFNACPPKYGYVPFGAGPRRCIGDNLALLVLEHIVAAVRDQGRLVIADPWAIPETAGITVRPRGPVPARWERCPSRLRQSA